MKREYPIWKEVTEDDVRQFSPIIAARLAAHADAGVDAVADQLRYAIQADQRSHEVGPTPEYQTVFNQLSSLVDSSLNAHSVIHSVEGVKLADQSARQVHAIINGQLQSLSQSSEHFKVATFPEGTDSGFSLHIRCPGKIQADCEYSNLITNSAERARISFTIDRTKPGPEGSILVDRQLFTANCHPWIGADEQVVWIGDFDSPMPANQLAEFFLNTLLRTIANEFAPKER